MSDGGGDEASDYRGESLLVHGVAAIPESRRRNSRPSRAPLRGSAETCVLAAAVVQRNSRRSSVHSKWQPAPLRNRSAGAKKRSRSQRTLERLKCTDTSFDSELWTMRRSEVWLCC